MADPKSTDEFLNLPIAFVLTDHMQLPDMEAIARALRIRHPALEVEVCDCGADRAGGSLIRCGGEFITIMAMPGPVLPYMSDPAWTRASGYWPQAQDRAAAGRGRGHVIITPIGTPASRLQTTRILTAVTGAVIASTPECRAVVWDGRMVRSAGAWLQLSESAFVRYPDYPITGWIDIVPFRSGAMLGAVTMGLSRFVNREIEFEATNWDIGNVLEKVAGLAAYLTEHGDVVRDGHTIGCSEEERLTVRHTTSTRFAGLPILHAADGAPASGRFAHSLKQLFQPRAITDLGRFPTDQQAAAFVGMPPHDGGILSSYIDGVRGVIGRMLRLPECQHAHTDADARNRLAAEVREFEASMQHALVNQRLFAFYPPHQEAAS